MEKLQALSRRDTEEKQECEKERENEIYPESSCGATTYNTAPGISISEHETDISEKPL